MKLAPSPVSNVKLQTLAPSPPPSDANAVPHPPARWARWWTSPIARFDYGAGSLVPAWHEAWIPADRGLTGDLRPSVIFGGSTREAAVAAAHLLAQQAVRLDVDLSDGSTRSVSLHPAIAVLRDARAGAFWLAPLRTSVRSHGEWIEAPHSIDGDGFAGEHPLLRTPSVLSATRDMVTIVGRDTELTPGRWTDAPDDSLVDDPA